MKAIIKDISLVFTCLVALGLGILFKGCLDKVIGWHIENKLERAQVSLYKSLERYKGE